mgnify:CR=1 FL=1
MDLSFMIEEAKEAENHGDPNSKMDSSLESRLTPLSIVRTCLVVGFYNQVDLIVGVGSLIVVVGSLIV